MPRAPRSCRQPKRREPIDVVHRGLSLFIVQRARRVALAPLLLTESVIGDTPIGDAPTFLASVHSVHRTAPPGADKVRREIHAETDTADCRCRRPDARR